MNLGCPSLKKRLRKIKLTVPLSLKIVHKHAIIPFNKIITIETLEF